MRVLVPFLLLLALIVAPTITSAETGAVLFIPVDDVIGPISARYILDGLDEAARTHAPLVVIELDTPGGLDSAMRGIIKGILSSPVPVCVYVAPNGARAASAGVYIAYAAHIAAMAPSTNLGSASPVSMGGGEMDSTMAKKIKNDAVAYIRGLARLRDRNEAWAVEAVEEAVSLPAEDAVARGVVDLIADSREDLLAQVHGRVVALEGDSAHVVTIGDPHTATDFEKSLRYRLLAALNNPNVAYMLLILGFYGIFFELSNPGAVFPGVAGAISLILGLFALQSLSMNYAGLLLLLLGVGLFLLETQVTSHGVLSIGGAVALFAGSVLLIDSPEPAMRVSMKLIVPVVLVTSGFFFFAVTLALRAQKRRQVAGREGMIGKIGIARTSLEPGGTVFVAGEHWSAVSEGAAIAEGAEVEVVALDHLQLTVRPAAGP